MRALAVVCINMKAQCDASRVCVVRLCRIRAVAFVTLPTLF
jgi:hypothetical protein